MLRPELTYDFKALINFIAEFRKTLSEPRRWDAFEFDTQRFAAIYAPLSPRIKMAFAACALNGTSFMYIGRKDSRHDLHGSATPSTIIKAAASVLLMAIFTDISQSRMRDEFTQLIQSGTNANNELIETLVNADKQQSRLPGGRIKFHNFYAAGPAWMDKYINETANAFVMAGEIIDLAREEYLVPPALRSYPTPRVNDLFHQYFGDPLRTTLHRKNRNDIFNGMLDTLHKKYHHHMQEGRIIFLYSWQEEKKEVSEPLAAWNSHSHEKRIMLFRRTFTLPVDIQVWNMIYHLIDNYLPTQNLTRLQKSCKRYPETSADIAQIKTRCKRYAETDAEKALINTDNYAFFLMEAFGHRVINSRPPCVISKLVGNIRSLLWS